MLLLTGIHTDSSKVPIRVTIRGVVAKTLL